MHTHKSSSWRTDIFVTVDFARSTKIVADEFKMLKLGRDHPF